MKTTTTVRRATRQAVLRRLLPALGLAVLGLAGPARAATAAPAEADWPRKPIRWIVPFLPGTAPDSSARVLADAMAPLLKQNIIIDNRAGAAGNLGAQAAARAAPDGHTWVYAANTMASAMRMYRAPGYDVLKDFVPVGRISVSDIVVIAPADAKLASARDLIERARQQPGQLNYASGGIGTPAHLGAALMLSVGHADATHVPFKGASESLTAVMGRQVDFALSIVSVALVPVKSGKVVPLAVTGPKRSPALPQVPTLAEQGLPGVDLQSFGGLAVPAGTPPAVVARLNAVLNEALAKPAVQAHLETLGTRPMPSTPQAFGDELRAEIAATERRMVAAKLEPQ